LTGLRITGEGVAAGLLLDPSGSLIIRPFFVPTLAAVVAEMATVDWSELSAQTLSAPLSSAVAVDGTKLAEIREALESQTASIPPSARPAWEALTSRFAARPADPP
jgi:hypothetical protein